MTDVFNDDLLLEELHDLRASKRPISVVPLTFLEPTSRLGFFASGHRNTAEDCDFEKSDHW
jgi:hypothetical protein